MTVRLGLPASAAGCPYSGCGMAPTHVQFTWEPLRIRGASGTSTVVPGTKRGRAYDVCAMHAMTARGATCRRPKQGATLPS